MARTSDEYKFLPNQSGIRSDSFGQFSQSHSLSMEGPSRSPQFVLGHERLPKIHANHGHSSRVSLLSQQDRQGSPYQSPSRDDNVSSPRELYPNTVKVEMNSYLTDCQTVGPENPKALTSGQFLQNNAMHIDKKRKVSLSYLQ